MNPLALDDKPWYTSKAMLAGVAMAVLAIADAYFGAGTVPMQAYVFLLGVMGIATRQAVGAK